MMLPASYKRCMGMSTEIGEASQLILRSSLKKTMYLEEEEFLMEKLFTTLNSDQKRLQLGSL